MSRSRRWQCQLLVPAMLGAAAQAAPVAPGTFVTNDNPWQSGYPLLQLDATRPEHTTLELRASAANVFQIQQGHDETLELDGEVQRGIVRIRMPLTPALDMSFQAHYVRHDTGIWDSIIQDWHQFFQLPNGGRELRDKNRLFYRHTDASGTHEVSKVTPAWRYFEVEGGWSRGDREHPERFQFAVSWSPADNAALGAAEWAIHGGWTRGWSLSPELSAQAGAGMSVFAGGDDALEDRRHVLRFQGRAGLAWQPWTVLVLTGQLDTHTPLYDSRMDALGNLPLILSLGARVPLGRLTLETGFSEDLNPGASPDWSTWIAVRTSWD
ncbi:DUF3187 family protein [Hahella sp. SMD15-11]|uniref:DUF3187 family protein n=1 Tax=Thermohahella caldifontis TaxID=3142973 RepID=A0AB39UYV9_9GAMM